VPGSPTSTTLSSPRVLTMFFDGSELVLLLVPPKSWHRMPFLTSLSSQIEGASDCTRLS
jgi:hypothetical protein